MSLSKPVPCSVQPTEALASYERALADLQVPDPEPEAGRAALDLPYTPDEDA